MLHHDRSGSTVIVLFPRNFMRFDEDLLKYSKEGLETVVKVGEQIGTRL
jgi:phosphatidylserine decarboxylase